MIFTLEFDKGGENSRVYIVSVIDWIWKKMFGEGEDTLLCAL